MRIKFDMIITIMNQGYSNKILQITKEIGVGGATFIKGRGAGIHETNSVMGINILPEKEIVIILVNVEDKKRLMQAICEKAGLNTESHGLCFSIPVEDWSGICHLQRNKVKKQIIEATSIEQKNDANINLIQGNDTKKEQDINDINKDIKAEELKINDINNNKKIAEIITSDDKKLQN